MGRAHAGFEDFYGAQFPRAYRILVVATGSEELAADATQEALIRAFVRWPRLREEQWAAGWVITTAMNVARRRAARDGRIGSAVEAQGTRSVANVAAQSADIGRALRQLPFRQRQAVVLFYLEDLPLAQVASLMQLSEGAVKSHLARGRRKLLDKLEVSE